MIPVAFFLQFFRDDIKYLLSMHNLWKKRKPPTPIDFEKLVDKNKSSEAGIRDQRVWGMKECADVFEKSVTQLKGELQKQGEGGMLVWDKVGGPLSTVKCRYNAVFGVQEIDRVIAVTAL